MTIIMVCLNITATGIIGDIMSDKILKLHKAYDNDKTKQFLQQLFGGSMYQLTEEELVKKASLWYAIMIEMVDNPKLDYNHEIMEMQMLIKGQFMIDSTD